MTRIQTDKINWVYRSISNSVLRPLAALLLLPGILTAGEIQDIEYSQLPDGGVQIKISQSTAAVEPSGFTIEQPARLILDFADTTLDLASNRMEMGLSLTQSLIALQTEERARIVVNLNQAAGWTTQANGNDLFVTISAISGNHSATTQSSASGNQISAIDFNRGSAGEGRITVDLSNETVRIDSREEPGQVVVEFLGTAVPDELARKLNVTDFGTPVTKVTTRLASSGSTQMVIEAEGDYDVLAYQTNNRYTVEIQPISALSGAELKRLKKTYDGERLSLNFQNIEVRSVLQLLADFTGKNLVASDTVTGNVTLRLKNVPWDQALDIILTTKGLAKREDGNVMWVAPAEEVAARERLELEAQQQLEELAPLYTEYVNVNFARASDLSTLITAEENNLLTERGSLNIDERTNTLIVHDTEEKIADIRQLVATLDVPVQQVLIESRIVNASTDFSKNLGVRFGAFKTKDSRSAVSSGSLNATTQALNGDDLEFQDRMNVNMPAGGLGGFGASSIAFAISKADRLLELELSALEAEGKGEILSNPRVVTSNQREAVISQGTQIAYQEASSSGATSTSFQDAVLSLRVTPQITPDDHIIMDLEVSKDAVGALVGGVPTIDTQNINTQVLVDNGDTIVIGGIYEQTKTNSATRTPFLGDLPYVGFMFRNKTQTNDKSELLIFVTPKILRDGLAAAL